MCHRYLICAAILACILSCSPRPVPRSAAPPGPIDIILDPAMQAMDDPQVIRLARDGYDIAIKLKAKYVIGALVLHREN